MTRDRARTLISLTVAALLTISSVTSTVAAMEPGGDSPEEVFERMRTAATDKNYEEMGACLSPGGRAQMSAMMLMMASMAAAFSDMGSAMAADLSEASGGSQPPPSSTFDLNAELETLLARHGMDESPVGAPGTSMSEPPQELETVEFFADIMTLVDSLPEDPAAEGSNSDGFSVPKGDLTDLKLDGDIATARIGDEPADFVRVDGRWYVDPKLEI